MSYLKSYALTPPGGYPYQQTQGIPHSFPSLPIIEAQAEVVAGFRRANGLPRASTSEALEDISYYTCARLGNMPQFCTSPDGVQFALGPTSPLVKPCMGCGAPIAT